MEDKNKTKVTNNPKTKVDKSNTEKNKTAIIPNLQKHSKAKPKKLNLDFWIPTSLGVSLVGLTGFHYMNAEEDIAEETTDNTLSTEETVVYEEAPIATSVRNEMNFSEAFSSAREEVGAGGVFLWQEHRYNTYYESEWNNMENEAKQAYANSLPSSAEIIEACGGTPEYTSDEMVVDETASEDEVAVVVWEGKAPVAVSVNDEMNFSDAFASAREEVGAGGVFGWNGEIYNTYYESELSAMSKAEINAYVDSLPPIDDILSPEIELTPIVEGDEPNIDGWISEEEEEKTEEGMIVIEATEEPEVYLTPEEVAANLSNDDDFMSDDQLASNDWDNDIISTDQLASNDFDDESAL